MLRQAFTKMLRSLPDKVELLVILLCSLIVYGVVGLCMLFYNEVVYAQSSPLTFRTVVLTSTGQLLNGILTDNVFYNPSGGTLTAKRYLANVAARPIVVPGQAERSIWIPVDTNLKLADFRTIEVYVNGLLYSPGEDYELFSRAVPAGTELCVRVTYLVSWQNAATKEPFLVRFRLQP